MSGNWSGSPDGYIPLEKMTRLRSDLGPGGYAQPDAAAAYQRMAADFQAAVGMPLKFSEGYRDYDTSVRLFTARYIRVASKTGLFWDGSYWRIKPGMAPAGIPGSSKHLKGLAIDFAAPLTSWDTAGQRWFRANEARYGFSSAQGVTDGEPWHKVYIGPTNTSASSGSSESITEQELDMGAYIISSPIGVTLVIDGVVAAGANTSDEYAGVKGATALTISGAQHKDYLAKLTQKQGLPLLCRVDGESGVYILTDKLRPIQVQATLANLQSAGAPTVTISPAERDAWSK